jgi:hypothetical protein
LKRKFKYFIPKIKSKIILLNYSLWLLVVLCASTHVFSQSSKPIGNKELSNKIILDYKIQTSHLISKNVIREKISLDVLTIVAELDTTSTDTASFFYTSEEIALHVFQKMIKQEPLTNQMQFDSFALISFLEEYKLRNGNLLKDFFLTFKKLARIHGVTVAVVWFSTELAQIITIGYLTSIGFPEVAVMAPFVPLSFFNTGLAVYIKSIRHKNRLKKGYGSSQKKKKGQQAIRKTNRKFMIKNKNSIIHSLILEKDSVVLATVHKNNLIISVGSVFSLNKRKLYYKNVRRFAKKNLPESEYNQIKSGIKDFDKEVKTIFWLENLKNNQINRSKLQQNFKKSVKTFHISDYPICSLQTKEWVFKALELKSFSEFSKLIKDIPENLIIEEVLDYLENIIIPYWSENLGKVGFKKFRIIVKGVAQTRYDTLNRSQFEWNKEISKLLLTNCKFEE